MVGSYRIECSNHRCRENPLIRADGFKTHLILRLLCITAGSIFPTFFNTGVKWAQKTRRRWGLRRVIVSVRLFGNDVGCLRTFFPLGLFEFDLLALFQRFESFRLNFREVNKNVLPFLRFYKTVTLAFVEPLHFT